LFSIGLLSATYSATVPLQFAANKSEIINIIFRFKLSPKSILDFKRSDIAAEMTWSETGVEARKSLTDKLNK
jgi:hypothetical protein